MKSKSKHKDQSNSTIQPIETTNLAFSSSIVKEVDFFATLPRPVIINILKFIDWKEIAHHIKLISKLFSDIYHTDLLNSLYKKALLFEKWQYQEIAKLSNLINKFLDSEKISYFNYPSISYSELTRLFILFCAPTFLLYRLFDTYKTWQQVSLVNEANKVNQLDAFVKKQSSFHKDIVDSFNPVNRKPLLEAIKKYEAIHDNLRKEIQSNSQKAEELLTQQFKNLAIDVVIAVMIVILIWTCFIKIYDYLYQNQLMNNSTIQKLKNYIDSEYKDEINTNPFKTLILESIASYIEDLMPIRKDFRAFLRDQLVELLNEANIYSNLFHAQQEKFKTQVYLKPDQLKMLKSSNEYFSNYSNTITFWSNNNRTNSLIKVSNEAPSLKF